MEEISTLRTTQQLLGENPENILKIWMNEDQSVLFGKSEVSVSSLKETKINWNVYDDALNGFDVGKTNFNEDLIEIDPSMYNSREFHDFAILLDEKKTKHL